MNMLPRLKYEVSETIIDTKSLLDEENFYHQKQGAPSELTKKLTYILGDYNKNYPISLMTMGGIGYGGNALARAAVELDDPQFTYPVMGRLSKASVVTKSIYTDGVDKPGIGHGEFKLYFSDNLIKRFFIIQSSRGTQAHVRKDPENVGGYWEYTVVLDPALSSDYCAVSETLEGASWVALYTAVPESRSRSTETSMAMPGQYKNQMGFMRTGMSWAGNSANKVMRIDITTPDGNTTNVWMDWFMWQFENDWLSQCEHSYWYSRYNRLADGTVPLKDLLSGKVIPRGSGILEQVQNKSTYSSLTYNYIQNIVGEALYSQTDQKGKSLTFHGGMGFLREFDTAMKAQGINMLTDWGMVADKFVSGSGRNLMLGGFFDGFYHIDGYTIKVKHNPVFDSGKVAMGQVAGGYVHPETGWALESYRGVFIDDSDYDGQPNIQHVAQTGRSFLHGIIPGLTPMPKSIQMMAGSFNITGENQAALIASDVDESSYTRFKSCGIQILRANTCFDLQCIAGL
jgi:hypothetical protein